MEPTYKRFMLAIDVSGSMTCSIPGTRVVTCREAAGAMAMVTGNHHRLSPLIFFSLLARTERNCRVMGFSDQLVPININPDLSLHHVTAKMSNV